MTQDISSIAYAWLTSFAVIITTLFLLSAFSSSGAGMDEEVGLFSAVASPVFLNASPVSPANPPISDWSHFQDFC